MLNLAIPEEIYRQMVAQAREEAPIEACGILAGRDGAVLKRYEMTNADNATDHFMLAPAEQFAVVKDMRSAGLEMLAVYHSHPETPARPSEEDIRLAVTPGVAYVIVSLPGETPSVRGVLIEDGYVSEAPVTIVKG